MTSFKDCLQPGAHPAQRPVKLVFYSFEAVLTRFTLLEFARI